MPNLSVFNYLIKSDNYTLKQKAYQIEKIHNQRENLLPVIQGQNPVRSTVTLFPVPGHGAGGLNQISLFAGNVDPQGRI